MPFTRPARTHSAWLVPSAVGIVVVALIALILSGALSGSKPEAARATTTGASPSPHGSLASAPPTQVAEPAATTLADAARRDPKDVLAKGPADAPVVLVVFSDYQCPFCAKWSKETLPAMMKYVDAGKLRIEWRDVNVYGPDSLRASQAAYAAGLQGKFWEYHHELYPDGAPRSPADLTEGALVDLAKQLSLDVPRFRTDMASDTTVTEIKRNQDLGIALGAFSTPAFVMGGEAIVGAQPTQVFADAFERAYAAATQ